MAQGKNLLTKPHHNKGHLILNFLGQRHLLRKRRVKPWDRHKGGQRGVGNSVVLWRRSSVLLRSILEQAVLSHVIPSRRKATYLLASLPKYLPTTSCRHIWKQPFTIKDGKRVDIILREGKRMWREINLA